MVLLSATGTLRAILVLVIIWQVLRIVARMQAERSAPGFHRAPPDPRQRGEVRIEQAERPGRTGQGSGTVVDADFEEIR